MKTYDCIDAALASCEERLQEVQKIVDLEKRHSKHYFVPFSEDDPNVERCAVCMQNIRSNNNFIQGDIVKSPSMEEWCSALADLGLYEGQQQREE